MEAGHRPRRGVESVRGAIGVLGAVVAAVGLAASAAWGTAGGQTSGSVCPGGKLTVTEAAIAGTDGVHLPLQLDVTTADLSQLAMASTAASVEEATAWVLPIYRARVMTVAVAAALSPADAVALRDGAELVVERPEGARSWLFRGRVSLVVQGVEVACDLAELPEVAGGTITPPASPDTTAASDRPAGAGSGGAVGPTPSGPPVGSATTL